MLSFSPVLMPEMSLIYMVIIHEAKIFHVTMTCKVIECQPTPAFFIHIICRLIRPSKNNNKKCHFVSEVMSPGYSYLWKTSESSMQCKADFHDNYCRQPSTLHLASFDINWSLLWSSQLWATFYQLNYDIAINKLLSKKDRDNYIFLLEPPPILWMGDKLLE